MTIVIMHSSNIDHVSIYKKQEETSYKANIEGLRSASKSAVEGNRTNELNVFKYI